MRFLLLFAAGALAAAPAFAQTRTPAPAPSSAPSAPPRLIVAISVDQFSADLFAQYRQHFTAGLARLANGMVFPSGYQSHAATETCPGHSTILSGSRPSRTGIIANEWVDLKIARTDKTVYCAEDETVPGSSSDNYTVSARHLEVPVLTDWMKRANPASRVVAVAGKDRAAVMMGGPNADQSWWWNGKVFATFPGRTNPPAVVARANAAVQAMIAMAEPPLELPPVCRHAERAFPTADGRSVGSGRFARAAGDTRAFRASPAYDGAVLALAAGFLQDMKLGRGPAPDLLIIGASATDYVGHSYGTGGTEMCLQMLSLDRDLGRFFDLLDSTGIDYAVVLTADHGGHDLPERSREHAAPDAVRVDPKLAAPEMGRAIAGKLGLPGQLLWGGTFGDIWIDPKLAPADRARVKKEAMARYAAHPQVQAVFDREEIAATPSPTSPPDTWTLLQRARASFFPARSGDFVVALKPRVTPIPDTGRGYVATHGSFWDYDRRVPILFWRKGMTPFEQPLAVETADILPTLAGLLDISVPAGAIDGRCLDLDAGPDDTCR